MNKSPRHRDVYLVNFNTKGVQPSRDNSELNGDEKFWIGMYYSRQVPDSNLI